MRAKSKDGQFDKDFDPLNWGSPYTEGSAYQNSYNVYHDVEGLIGEFGGKEEFEKNLMKSPIQNQNINLVLMAMKYTKCENLEWQTLDTMLFQTNHHSTCHIYIIL